MKVLLINAGPHPKGNTFTALREVADGKLISEVDFDAIARAEEAKTRWQRHAAMKSIFAD